MSTKSSYWVAGHAFSGHLTISSFYKIIIVLVFFFNQKNQNQKKIKIYPPPQNLISITWSLWAPELCHKEMYIFSNKYMYNNLQGISVNALNLFKVQVLKSLHCVCSGNPFTNICFIGKRLHWLNSNKFYQCTCIIEYIDSTNQPWNVQ